MSIYQGLYNLINQYIFGNSIVANSVQDLATTLISLSGCIFLIAVPFMLVWKVIKVILG